MSKQNSLREAYEKIKKNNTSPNVNRLTELEQAIANYGKSWQGKENTAALNKKLHFEKMRAAAQSNDELLKKLNNISESVSKQSDLYSKYKTADEYNTAVKNQGYADKYKNYTYQQIDKLLNSDNYKTMRRRGIIDESEALWLKNQKYALATAKEVESELKNKKTLFAGNRTNENLDFNFNQPKKVFKEADLTQLLDETKVKNEEWAKSKGYKNYAEYLREYPDFEGEIEVLETVLAQKKKQENFNKKWGDVNVEGGYTPKINKNETDNLYDQINDIVPDGWIKEKDTKTKAKYLRDRAVTDADYIAEMSPQEKAKYNKIYDTQGIKKANEYYEDLVSLSLDKKVNEKEFQKAYNFTSSGGLNAVIGNIASVGDSLSSGVEFVANNLMGETNKRVVSATRSQGFREGTKTHWDGAWGEDVWDFLYDTGMSGVDSAAAAGLSAVVPYLGEVLLGGSAAASTYNDALDRGISHGDAILSSVAAGVAESLFEHVSIGNLSSLKPSSFAGLGFTKAGIKKAATEIGKQMLVNATEETLTEIANVVSDQLINGELSSYAIAVKDYYMQGMTPEEAKKKAAEDVGKQVLLAGASGLLMGFGFGTGGSIVGLSSSQIKNSKNGNTIISNGNVETLKILAVDSDIKNIVKDAEKLTEKSKPSEVGSVYNRLVENAVESSVKEMTPVLLENGAKESGSNSAKGWATQIANSLFDKNEGKKAELSINKVTSEVYSDFTTEGKYGGDKLLNLKDIISTPYLNQKTTASEVGTVLNENGIEAPVAADGSGAAIGPVMGDTVKGIAAAPRSGEIRTITEAYKQGVAENLEKQRPNPKAMSEKQFMKTYFADKVQISPEEEKILKEFGKANGLDVEFVDGAVNGKGYGVFQNGKQIVISRYAKKPMAALFKHEFTHSIEKVKGYAKFQKYVLEESKAFKGWLNVKGFANWAALSNSIVKNYEESGVDYEDPYIKAKADIIADFVGDVLFGEVIDAKGNPIKLDTNFLVELKKNDRNLFQRFVEWVHSILKRLTTKGVVNKDIIKLEQKFKRLVEQSRQQRAKGESKKSQGEYVLAREVNEATQKVGVEYDAETESVAPQYSLATWLDSDYVKDRNNAAQEISNAIGVSKKTAIKYINSINSIAKIIADDRVRLDYDAATGKTSFVSNVEYGGSIDFSTLCQKRKWLTGTFSAIQRELKNSALTASEVLKIRNMLKEKGIEVSCGLCYVEGSRAEMGVFAKQFIERYKKTNPQYTPDMVDVNTPEGVEALRVNHPEVYEAYENFWNNKGVLNEGDSVLFASQRKPKLYSVRTDYKHEILDKFKSEDNVVEKNQNGGLRIQSFSDFEIVHLIDMMQVIMDMSRVGLAGQAYTKVPDFALALGDTGLKINLSLIAKGVDANGNLIFDDVEGMPIDTAMRLRNMYSKNVGTILVIFNDAQLKAAFKDDRVDFIIPFHRSQWKRSQYAELGLPKDTKDYTYMQNERYIKPVYYTTRKGTQGKRKATNYMPIKDYWDFNKSGKENAESYLKLCAENNKRPKFYKLLVDNKDGSYSLQPDGSTDGYWKLLIDFKMYDNTGKGSPQTPVKPTFNMKESMRMLEEYKGDHASFPADQETVDAFVKEYKSKHKLDNFNESNRGKIEVKDDYDVGSYSLPDLDTEYIKAVESGDMETAQRMVDEAAEKAGYTINAYHGTPDSRNLVYNKITGSIDVKGDFSIFDSSKSRADRVDGSAFFFTNNEKVAKFYSPEQGYKPKVYNSKLKIVNPLFVECNGANWNEIPFDKLAYSYPTPNGGVKTTNKVTTKDIAQYARENGYDGVVFENIIDGKADTSENIGTVYAVFSSNQIKSADPVTYDDKGKVIPLSQRFNPENEDIRYSLPDLDSSGQKLSEGQMEYFKDSKVVDDDGNLLVLYHGTSDGGYTVFDPKYSDDKRSIFLTDDIQTANSYIREQKYHDKILKTPSKKPDALKWLEGDPTKSKNKKGLYKVYANIKNPLVVDCKGSSWNEIPFGKNDVYEVSYADGKVTVKELNSGETETQAFTDAEIEAEAKPKEYFEKLFNAEEAERLTWFLKIKPKNATNRSILGNFTWDGNRVTAGDSTRSISKFAKEQGYDGVIFKNVRDYGTGLKPKEIDAEGAGKNVYIVFDSNQIKSVNNTNPTEDKDIRYSLPDIPDIARGKSNEELDKLVSEGKITTKQALDAAREEHGTMPKGENPKVDVDVPNKVSDTKGVRRFARTALESGHLTEGMSEDAKREIINGALNYEISSNKMVTNIAEKKVAKDINKAIQEWEGLMASGKIPTAEDIALGEVLLVEAAKAGNANDVAMYLAEIAALGTQLGQGIQALSLLKKLTGVGQLHYVSRVIAQMNEDLKRRYGDKFQDVLSIDPNLEEILAKSKNQAEIEEVIDDILTDVAKQMPSTWLDKFNAWRYLAMLGNTRTHIRNFLGNAIFLPAIRIKDALGTIGERMFIKDASHRTKVFKVNKKYREYAMKDFEEVKGLLTRGGKMNPSDIVQDRRKIFTSKLFAPVEKFRKFNFDMLEAEDLIFLKKHYIHALGSVLQSRGLDVNNITEQQLKDARDYAINEAQKATYRDFSFFANMLNKLAHPTKNGKPVRDVATKGLAVLIEGALPFKKTPINILKRGIEYSPLGIATTFGNAIIAGRRGEFSGAEFIDGITAGMTGTMILGLGMLLQSMGWLVGGLGYDDEDALERLSGAQPYAIDFGDWSYTIDWMAPSSLPLLIGAEISKALDKEEGQISDLLLAIAEPMTELSFLQGVNDIIEGVAYSGENGLGVTGEVVTNLASTYVSQYFPTLTGQVARTFDDTRRANFVDKSSAVPKTLQKTAQKILGKIPFAENQKIPYIDAWGRTEENDNFLLRAFENFVSPGYVSKIEDDKVNNELAKVYTNTGESGVIPKKAGTSFSVNGKMVYLDAEKYVQYATDKGQYSRRYLEEMMSGGLYNGLSSDGKAEAIAFLFSYANAKAKSNVSDYDYREVSTYKTAAKLEDAGISPASYAVAKFAMSKENADTDGNDSVSKSEKQKALRNAGFSSREANKILNINKK